MLIPYMMGISLWGYLKCIISILENSMSRYKYTTNHNKKETMRDFGSYRNTMDIESSEAKSPKPI
jgi:hypothetical protein